MGWRFKLNGVFTANTDKVNNLGLIEITAGQAAGGHLRQPDILKTAYRRRRMLEKSRFPHWFH